MKRQLERCFCGCGAARSRRDRANRHGWATAHALAWILKVKAVLEHSGRSTAIENLDAMASSGLVAYRNLLADVHTGNQQARKYRKQTERWLLFVLDAQGSVRNRAGEIKELELAPFTTGDIRHWALKRELPESYETFKHSLVMEDDEG